jgi:hypothetical protein
MGNDLRTDDAEPVLTACRHAIQYVRGEMASGWLRPCTTGSSVCGNMNADMVDRRPLCRM